MAPICDEEGNLLGAVQCIRDIGERKKMEDELRYLSTHDALTGVHNRAFFERELQRLEKERFFPVSFIVCDLDGLKIVNDALGHDKGDELLCRAARVFMECVPGSSVVTRVGGDEFVIILPQTERKVAEEIVGCLLERAARDSEKHPNLPLNFSIGVATAETALCSLQKAYAEADNAHVLGQACAGSGSAPHSYPCAQNCSG